MTTNSDKRKLIIEHCAEKYKLIDFKKTENSLIRESENGLIQVIDFVLGQNSSIMKNHLGIGFGIFIDEWFKHLNFGLKPKKIDQSHCELRIDFNESIPKKNNIGWFDLNQNIETIISETNNLIEYYFIPELNQLSSRRKIIEQWNAKGNAIGLPPRGSLSIAILYWYLNEKEKAKEQIESELKENIGKPYGEFVQMKYDELIKNVP